jgi:hypothetical protein
MATAAARLWRRSPLWRGALILALPLTALAWFHPPARLRPVGRVVWTADADPSPTVSLGTSVPPALPAPQFPTSTPAPTPVSPLSERTATTDRMLPYYRSLQVTGIPDEAGVAAREVGMRPRYALSVPFEHREIPLPPGVWTTVAVDREFQLDRSTPGLDILLVRLDGHTVTGALLLRGSDTAVSSAIDLDPNPYCRPGRGLRVFTLPASSRGDACWFVNWPVAPNLLWPLPEAPPAARLAVRTLAATGDHLPVWMVGATYFRSDGHQWIEVSYLFDPARNGVVPTGDDGNPDPNGKLQGAPMEKLAIKLQAWMEQRIPALEHLGSALIGKQEAAKLNKSPPL